MQSGSPSSAPTPLLVRKPEHLTALDALVLPGGESSTFLKHLERAGFYDALNDFCHAKPVFGTCAGCILLAKGVTHPTQASFGVLDITVERNAYGRQNDSAYPDLGDIPARRASGDGLHPRAAHRATRPRH